MTTNYDAKLNVRVNPNSRKVMLTVHEDDEQTIEILWTPAKARITADALLWAASEAEGVEG